MKIMWKSEDRVIPGFGVAIPNNEIELPDALARQFIDQGQAVEVKRADPKARVKVDEV